MQKKKILIVEDERDLLHMLHLRAGRHNLECYLDGTGTKCVEKALKYQPDLILLDLNLPTQGGGFDIIRELKSRESLAHIPIVVYSALPAHEVASEVLSLGAEAFYSKFDHPVDIFEHVKKHIKETKNLEDTQSFSADDLGTS